MNNVEQFQFIFHIFAILANYQKIGVKLIYHNYDPEFDLGNGILNQSSIVQLMNVDILDTCVLENVICCRENLFVNHFCE